MADKQIDKYLPKLRFPEFKVKGEWQVVRLGDVVSCFSGGTPSATNKDYYGGDIPFIRSGELHSSKTELFLTRAGLENSSAKMVEKGTILYALYGATSGDVGIARVSGAINQAILAIIPHADIDKMYLYHFLSYSKDFIINRFLQGGQGNLSASIITSLSIPLPTIQEQKKIASCLSSLEDCIVASKEKQEQLKAHKKGLIQKLFPSRGKAIPVYRLPEFKDSDDWRCVKLKEIINVNSGRDYKHLKSGSIPVYGTGGHMTNVNEWLSDVDAVGIGRKGTIDQPQYLKAPFWTVDTLFYLTPTTNQDILFIYFLTQTIPWKKYGEQTGVPSLSKKSIEELEVYIPHVFEQRKIATILSSVDMLIKLEGKKLEYLSLHKQGLLRVLLG